MLAPRWVIVLVIAPNGRKAVGKATQVVSVAAVLTVAATLAGVAVFVALVELKVKASGEDVDHVSRRTLTLQSLLLPQQEPQFFASLTGLPPPEP